MKNDFPVLLSWFWYLPLDGSFNHGHFIWKVPPFGLKRVDFLESTVVSFIGLRSFDFLDFCHTPLDPINAWSHRIFLNHLTFLTNHFAVLAKANLNIKKKKKETFLHSPSTPPTHFLPHNNPGLWADRRLWPYRTSPVGFPPKQGVIILSEVRAWSVSPSHPSFSWHPGVSTVTRATSAFISELYEWDGWWQMNYA